MNLPAAKLAADHKHQILAKGLHTSDHFYHKAIFDHLPSVGLQSKKVKQII